MAKSPMGQHEYLKLIFVRIQESLKVIYPRIDEWKAICTRGKICVRRIENLIDQMESFDKANLSVLSEFSFDTKEKLECKLQVTLEEELNDLNAILKELKDNLNVISSECYLVLNTYQENSKHLEFQVQVSESVKIPILTDMIEYITTLQAFFQEEYQVKKIVTAKVDYDDTKSFRDLKYWAEFNLQVMGMIDLQLLMPTFLNTNLNDVDFFEITCI